MTGRLAKRLAAMAAASAERIPAESQATMHAATQALVESGQADRAPAVGQPFPAFELPDQDGRSVRSAQVLERGPVIVSFFRGHW